MHVLAMGSERTRCDRERESYGCVFFTENVKYIEGDDKLKIEEAEEWLGVTESSYMPLSIVIKTKPNRAGLYIDLRPDPFRF